MKVYSIRLIHPKIESLGHTSYYATKDALSQNHYNEPWTPIGTSQWLIVTPLTARNNSLIYLIEEVEVWG